ncbi:hypothetical protein M2263_000438 [Providencia alcalifaciens]|nr:hypothetical protein [Providencia alcalifaciens]
MRVNNTIESSALQQNNNRGNSDAPEKKLASQVTGVKSMTNKPQAMPSNRQNKKRNHHPPLNGINLLVPKKILIHLNMNSKIPEGH